MFASSMGGAMETDLNSAHAKGGRRRVADLRKGAKLRAVPPANAAEDHETPPRSKRGAVSIFVRQPEYVVNDAATEALTNDIELYQRAGALVRVVHAGHSPLIDRPSGAPRIEQIEAATLRDRLSRACDFFRREMPRAKPQKDDDTVEVEDTEKPQKDDDTSEVEVDQKPRKPRWIMTAPPRATVAAVLARGSWPCRYLEGVVDEPVIRPDGSLLDRPGYDDATGLLLSDNHLQSIPTNPTFDECADAVAQLVNVVRDFPFAKDDDHAEGDISAHVSAWIALVLTPFARFAINGPVPLFLVEANVRGAGKSLLADLAAIIATGRRAARSTLPAGRNRDEELRKIITAIALAGDRFALFDNVNSTIGGSTLDAALTGMTWRDRLLGTNTMTQELPLRTVWCATGNNASLGDDTARRVLPIRLESDLERPEERSEFTIDNIREHVVRERLKLAACALTILRAFFAAGQPKAGLKPWGSFEAWSDVVREAIVFCGLPDPVNTRASISTSSTEAEGLHAFVHGLHEFAKSDPMTMSDAGWFRAAHVVERLRKTTDGQGEEGPRFARLREGVELLVGGERKLDAVSLGRLLRSLRGRVVDGLRIEREAAQRETARLKSPIARWTVR